MTAGNSLLLAVATLFAALSCPSSAAEPDYGEVPVDKLLEHTGPGAKDWISLFNGTDLQGWTPKIRGYAAGENYANTFRVEDGLLTVAYDGYEDFQDRFGHLFTDASYSHYILSVEYRFQGEQVPGGPGWAFENSGAMVHAQSARSMGRGQDFPISVEVQFLGGTGRLNDRAGLRQDRVEIGARRHRRA